MNLNSKILVTGHRGLVGCAVVRQLWAAGFRNIQKWNRNFVDLADPVATRWAFSVHEPEYVFHCAAKVGGIKANSENPVEFFLENIKIQNNVLMESARYGVKKLVFLGSSCIYPKGCAQPIQEDALMTGPLEKTNEAYALAKICGVSLARWYREKKGCDFVSAMPCNMYGPGDWFDPDGGHIVPGLMVQLHNARENGSPVFNVWGDGKQQREILFSDDLARALLVVMEKYSGSGPINTGSGFEITAHDLAVAIAGTVGFTGEIGCDESKPTGVRRKLLDNTSIFALGWRPQVDLTEGLKQTYQDFLHNPDTRR